MSRYDDIEGIAVPDQWSDIVERAEAGDLLDLEPDTPRRRLARVLPAVAVAATLLVAAITVGVVLDDEPSGVATDATSDTTNDTTLSPSGTDLPTLVCAGGELAAGSIPDDALPFAEGLAFDVSGEGPPEQSERAVFRSWSVGDVRLQFAVPGFPWIDSTTGDGEPTQDPPGRLVEDQESSVFIGETGLAAPCDEFVLEATGGGRNERDAAVLDAARDLEWVELPLVTSVDDVVDESTMRSFTLHKAAELLGTVGPHPGEIVVNRTSLSLEPFFIGEPGESELEHEPQLGWSGTLWTDIVVDDDGGFGALVITVNVGDSGEWNSSVGPVDGVVVDESAVADRDAIPALALGRRTDS